MATSVSSATATFQQTWRPGRRVQERGGDRRKGTIRAVSGTGAATAVIAVNLDGRPPALFRPGQLALL